MPCTLGVPVTGLSLKGFDGCTMTVYPRTHNCEITSFTSEWQIAKGGKGALFYSWIVVNDGKGQRVQ